MEVQKVGIGSTILDNEQQYYNLVESVIASIDEYANVIITKQPKSLTIRINPSEARLYPLILSELTQLHNILKIRLNFSKSIKNTTTIFFSIEF